MNAPTPEGGGAQAPPTPWRRLATAVGFTRTGTAVAIVAFIGWLVARAAGGKALFLLAYGAVVVLAVARILGRRRPTVTAQRSELPSRLRQGQSAEVELTIRAPRRTPLFVAEERLVPLLGRTRSIPVVAGTGDGLVHRYAVTPALRGVYEVGPLVAVWNDPFGLTRRETVLLESTTVIVHPATEIVTDRPLTRQWEDPPVRPPISKPWPTGFEFYGMRDYVPGDDLRRVVWTAVARTGRMLTRESEQGITDKVVIVLDTDGDRHTPGDVSDTFEASVKSVASLGLRHLKDGFGVTLRAGANELGRWRGVGASIPLLDALAAVQRTAVPLAQALEPVHGASRDAHTLIVTPHLEVDAAQRLRLLVQSGRTIVVVLLTWEESDPASLARAGALGCQVVRLQPAAPLAAAFLASSATIAAGRTGVSV